MNREDIENLVNTDFEKMQIIVNRIFKEEYVKKIEQENARLKDKIENAIKFVDEYMDEWDFHDEVWEDLNNLLILLKEN